MCLSAPKMPEMTPPPLPPPPPTPMADTVKTSNKQKNVLKRKRSGTSSLTINRKNNSISTPSSGAGPNVGSYSS